MPTVKVNGNDKAVVHKGSTHFSKATIPDVCKTPTPGGPVPIPYPNISMANSLAKGSTTVKADGAMIAIKGSEFSMSMGDEPGTVGGVKSSTFKKESTWITYSFDVKINGKNACRSDDKKFQNHENTVDMGGAGEVKVPVKSPLTCGEADTYGELKKRTAKGLYDRDHVPSKSALKEAGRRRAAEMGKDFTKAMEATIDKLGDTISIPKELHRDHSETYGGRSDPETDADNLNKAARRDLKAIEDNWGKHDKACLQAYKEAADEIREKIRKDPKYYEKWLTKIIDGDLT